MEVGGWFCVPTTEIPEPLRGKHPPLPLWASEWIGLISR